jgi:hypothetical protein
MKFQTLVVFLLLSFNAFAAEEVCDDKKIYEILTFADYDQKVFHKTRRPEAFAATNMMKKKCDLEITCFMQKNLVPVYQGLCRKGRHISNEVLVEKLHNECLLLVGDLKEAFVDRKDVEKYTSECNSRVQRARAITPAAVTIETLKKEVQALKSEKAMLEAELDQCKNSNSINDSIIKVKKIEDSINPASNTQKNSKEK